MAFSFKKFFFCKASSKWARFAWLRFFFGLSVFIAAASLWTPYPAELAKALTGAREQGRALPPEEDPDAVSPEDDRPHDAEEPADQGEDDPRPPVSVLPPPPGTTLNPQTEQGDLSQFSPLKIPRSTTSHTLIMPPLPPIIPDGPGEDGIWDINELSRGLNLKTELNFNKGGSASRERLDRSNYRMTLRMDITQPTPLAKAEEFDAINPSLQKIFPEFGGLFKNAKVSGFYHQLMARKQLELRKDLVTLNRLLTRHNYYDCETILEITAPGTGRKVLWIQADMDVVSDGTDGDRLPAMPAEIVNSAHYQPFTSYRWPKKTDKPNPLLTFWQKRLKDARAKSTRTSSQAALIDTLERGIRDMKNNSFLIADYDPFIVIPIGIMNNSASPFSPSPGDYAVVIKGSKLYPAIVGDAGPRYKIGEASLRLAKEVNPRSSSYRRPVSDLSVSYLVFPKSADPVKQAPDYAVWKEKCEALLQDLGGIAPGYSLHEWEDLLAPPPPPVIPAPPAGVKTPGILPSSSKTGGIPDKTSPVGTPASPETPRVLPPEEKTTPAPPAYRRQSSTTRPPGKSLRSTGRSLRH